MVKHIPLADIVDNPFQPRTTFDKAALRSLADEIQAGGFWGSSLQGRRKNGKVELVFGHRRLRALRMLKESSAPIELVDLTDAQMALRSLEENLQREGLTDLEKADAVKNAVEMERAELREAKKSETPALTVVADRLGLDRRWVQTLCHISRSMDPENRPDIEAGHLTAKTALAAKQWGGDAYMKTLAKQGKQSKRDPKVSKPTHMTVAAMKKAVAQAPEAVQEELKAEIIAGAIIDPQKAEQRARKLASTHTRRQKQPPPDLKDVLVGWTHRVKEWEQQMRDVAPYMDYVDEEAPAIGARFRAELQKLIETAKKLL